jgi:formate-dependent phosphoribosylglycinamide formyltransferase (GAR transformylase)
VEGSRGDVVEVIVEAFVKFNSELLITVVQNNNPLFLRQLVVKNVAIIGKLATRKNIRQGFV